MSAAEKSRKRLPSETGFDVTCVVGHVSLSEHGVESAHVAAFRLIAEHDAPGRYAFPNADGSTCLVHVEHMDARS